MIIPVRLKFVLLSALFSGVSLLAKADITCSLSLVPDFSGESRIPESVQQRALSVFSDAAIGKMTLVGNQGALTNNPEGSSQLVRGCDLNPRGRFYYVRWMDGIISANVRDCISSQESRYYGLGGTQLTTLTVSTKGTYPIWKDMDFPYKEMALSCR